MLSHTTKKTYTLQHSNTLNHKKSNSVKLTNDVVFIKANQTFTFHLYHDTKLGFNQLQTVDMKVDEDCQTTESVKKFGEKLCFNELKAQLQSQTSNYDSNSIQN